MITCPFHLVNTVAYGTRIQFKYFFHIGNQKSFGDERHAANEVTSRCLAGYPDGYRDLAHMDDSKLHKKQLLFVQGMQVYFEVERPEKIGAF